MGLASLNPANGLCPLTPTGHYIPVPRTKGCTLCTPARTKLHSVKHSLHAVHPVFAKLSTGEFWQKEKPM